MWRIAMLMGVLALGSGCGSDPCDDASEVLCDRACECGNGNCAFGNASGSISFENRADCVTFLKFACDQGGSDANVDWDQCTEDTEAGVCVGDAFPTPDSCDEPS